MTLKTFFHYLKTVFILDLKRNFAYPASFWIGLSVVPLWSVVNIVFIEVIYGQTSNFLGYTKYEMYVLFGTYRLAVNLAYFVFLKRLYELKSLIRGDSQETFDMVLVKPIDSQLYGTFGKFSFIEVSQLIVGVVLIWFGLYKQPHHLTLFNLSAYLILFACGVLFLYMLYLVLRCGIFWFHEFEVSEGLYETARMFGKYPQGLYTGPIGIIINILLPVTLTGAIPVDFLFGRIPWYSLFAYIGITALLFFLTRLFWFQSIKKYASFSS
ncbi:ABC-2 family transporter protein [soil metagenome]